MLSPRYVVDPIRLCHGASGDVVIELRRSLVGETHAPRATAGSIKLTHVGDQAIGFADDKCFIGRAAKYPHLFDTYMLGEAVVARPASVRVIPSHRKNVAAKRRQDRFRFLWGGLMRVFEYPSDKTRSDVIGNFFQLVDDQYVQVEEDGHGAVVLWSSDLPLDRALDRIDSALGETSKEVDGYVVDTAGKTTERKSDAIERLAREEPANVRLYVASYGNDAVSASWRREQIKLRGGRKPRAECSISAEKIDVKMLSKIVHLTGSSAVKEAFDQSLEPLMVVLGNAIGGKPGV